MRNNQKQILVLKSELQKLSENEEIKIGNGLGEYELEMDDITQFWRVKDRKTVLDRVVDLKEIT